MNEPHGYLGNPKLKTTNVNLKYTEEQIREFIQCAEDPIYFIRQYIKIVHVDKGLVPFDLWAFQENIINTVHNNRFTICKIPRQSGKSTVILSYLLYYILFNPLVSVVILANKADTAQELLSRLQLAYEYLPNWLQQGIVTWNKRNIELENGSKIKASATSSASVRGGSYNIIFLDEFAHIDNTLADQFFTSVYPTISSGQTTKVLIVSTPLGMNHFHKMWVEAEHSDKLRSQNKLAEANKISRFIPIEVHYSEVPGRDDEWREQEIANLGSDEKFEQEYGCEFIGSSNTLISKRKLRLLANSHHRPLYSQDGLDVYEDPMVDIIEDRDGFKENRPRKYVLCADTAQGKSLNYSSLVVVDVTEFPYKVVAKYRSNMISPLVYPNTIYNVARKYHNAHVLIEVNDAGYQVSQMLHYDLEYDNILTCVIKGRTGQQLSAGFAKTTQFGVKMTTPVKKTGCANLKSLIESNKLLLWDYDTIAEMTTFVNVGNSFKAEEGCNDDLVMSLVIFSWVASQKYFREMVETDIRLSMQQDMEDQLEYTMLPPPLINDGNLPDEIITETDVWRPATDFTGYYPRF